MNNNVNHYEMKDDNNHNYYLIQDAKADKILSKGWESSKEIPSFAKGGFVPTPTIAKIGDAKDPSGKPEGEWIVPDSKVRKVPNISQSKQPEVFLGKSVKVTTSQEASKVLNENASLKAQESSTRQSKEPAANITTVNNVQKGGESGRSNPPIGGTTKAVGSMSLNTQYPRWRQKMG